jgi:hypothetical protein
MKRAILLAILTAALAVGFGLGPGRGALAIGGQGCTIDATIDSEEQAFLGIINQYRAQNGLGPLELSNTLNKAAAWKSKHMADNNYFAHDDTPINRTWVERIRDCGHTYNAWLGENLAAGNDTAQEAFDQWRGSPGHNANMLNVNYNAIGIGRYYKAGSHYGWYWSTDFSSYRDGYTPPAPPPPSGPDTDGDGCLDSQELGSDQTRGGRRDPNNAWDFFDPNHDRAVTSSDILQVVNAFGGTPSDVRYAQNVDRRLLGPDPWDTGSPDGSVSALDINLIVNQFGHSCVP